MVTLRVLQLYHAEYLEPCTGYTSCDVSMWLSQEKLRLDMSDEDAVEWMQQLLSDSATALMPQITDRTHRWATYWLR